MLSNTPSPERARQVFQILAEECGCSVVESLPKGEIEDGRYVSIMFHRSGLDQVFVDLGEGPNEERIGRYNALCERLANNRNFPWQLRSAMVEPNS